MERRGTGWRGSKVGVQLEPQHCSVADLRRAWYDLDVLSVDSIWTWDHSFPVHGDPDGTHYEGWTPLTAAACDTKQSALGIPVSCNSYRPRPAADIARPADHVSGGRIILGIGAGWCQRDYEKYGFAFGTEATRVAALGEGLARVKARLARLNPPPIGPMPILVGGEGERVTLRLVAEHADIWNGTSGSSGWDATRSPSSAACCSSTPRIRTASRSSSRPGLST